MVAEEDCLDHSTRLEGIEDSGAAAKLLAVADTGASRASTATTDLHLDFHHESAD